MNRKQWVVLGIGLILLSFFLSFVSGMANCSDIFNTYNDLVIEAIDSDMGEEYLHMVTNSRDAWAISCFDMDIKIKAISTIIFTIGVLFIILGFLESKKH